MLPWSQPRFISGHYLVRRQFTSTRLELRDSKFARDRMRLGNLHQPHTRCPTFLVGLSPRGDLFSMKSRAEINLTPEPQTATAPTKVVRVKLYVLRSRLKLPKLPRVNLHRGGVNSALCYSHSLTLYARCHLMRWRREKPKQPHCQDQIQF